MPPSLNDSMIQHINLSPYYTVSSHRMSATLPTIPLTHIYSQSAQIKFIYLIGRYVFYRVLSFGSLNEMILYGVVEEGTSSLPSKAHHIHIRHPSHHITLRDSLTHYAIRPIGLFLFWPSLLLFASSFDRSNRLNWWTKKYFFLIKNNIYWYPLL